MFESNLLTQINVESPLPSFVEVEVVGGLNTSLRKAFEFAHVLLAEKSVRVATLLPWTDEIYYIIAGLVERTLLFHADTTFTELMFGIRRGELTGPMAIPPLRPASLAQLGSGAGRRYLRWLLLGPSPMMSPEERAIRYVNKGSQHYSPLPPGNHSKAMAEGGAAIMPLPHGSVDTSAPSRLSDSVHVTSHGGADGSSGAAAVMDDTVDTANDALAQLSAKELLSADRASYGHLRFKRLCNRKKWISILLLTLKPYLETKLAQWHARETDDTADAVALRQAHAYQNPRRAAVMQFLAKYLYPACHVALHSAEFLFKLMYVLELTPYASPFHRLFGIALRRSTSEDVLAASTPRARRALLFARVLLLLIFFGFRVLEFTRGGSASLPTSGESVLPLPPAPIWGSDVPAHPDAAHQPRQDGAITTTSDPTPGVCPVCHSAITNAAVCTASGVVGCYPCLQTHIRNFRVCPVTGKACTVEQVRRIYEC